jgi:anti-anti-sigma regulatory factor
MKFYLIVTKGKHQGMPIPISVDLFLVGTAKECQLRSNRDGLAPQHCALITRDRKVFVRDLHSGEPTMVNGNLVPPGEECPLHKGDRIEIGPFEFMLQFREKALSQRDLEEWALRSLDENNERDKEREKFDDETAVVERKGKVSPSQAAASILDILAARRGLVKGRLRIGREGNVTTVRINDIFLVDEGEIALIKRELYENLNQPNLRVLLDFKNVKRMSTVAVAMFDEICTWLRPWGSSLAMCRIRPEVQDIMRDLTLRNHVPVFPDKVSALEAKW